MNFIESNRSLFGLTGTNNIVRGAFSPNVESIVRHEFYGATRFGFDGDMGCFKSHQSARYWVDYQPLTRRPDTFWNELLRALDAASAKVDVLGLCGVATLPNQALHAAALETGLPFELVVLSIDDEAPDAITGSRVVSVQWPRFEDYCLQFSACTGSANPWVALQAFYGELSAGVPVDPSGMIKIVSNNFDEEMRKCVGPASWSVVDKEDDSAFIRWLSHKCRKGVPKIFRQTPELVAAAIETVHFRSWLASCSVSPIEKIAQASSDRAWIAVFKSCLNDFSYPVISDVWGLKNAWSKTSLPEKMGNLRQKLVSLGASADGVHLTPLSRFLEVYDNPYDFYIGEYESIYGSVRRQA
ncbi:hypothetical protein [Uliginosibacterium sp. TH139]|uniref:hypothetical protein n=1 Tax=Uliginosibacterium sp. TH139 TaxID=2067453 RepID=UPI00117E915D|nr:hypothetical protein [Uliginosibacterium sp. TH139]